MQNNLMVLDFEAIRPYHDSEVQEVLGGLMEHPMFKALLQFTFPNKDATQIFEIVTSCRSIYEFQTRVMYHSLQNLLDKSSEGFSTSGFDSLEIGKPYLFISNHRDIVLDTSLLNVALFEHQLVMTASAIGDNLVQKDFLMALSRLNRNFLVQRSQSPRELLRSSQKLSAYIKHLYDQGRSVWLAQREGRTKDGHDLTQQGVLKMLTMTKSEHSALDFLKQYRIVPVAISYEYDPTDILKVPEVVAKETKIPYVKTANEDFNSIMKGALGNKKHIHIGINPLSDEVVSQISGSDNSENDKLKSLGEAIDRHIYQAYKLWPSNYIAHDMYYKTDKYGAYYNEKEKRQFIRRIERRVNTDQKIEVDSFLLMYANPVINKGNL